MQPEVILKKLNFNEYETKIYLTLNSLNQATATEISQNSSVPRNKVYEILEKLKTEGFIMELPIKPKKFKIVSNDKLKEIVKDRLEGIKKLKDETDILVNELNNVNLDDKSKEPVYLIKSQKNIVNKIAYEMNNVKEESLSFFRGNASTGNSYHNTRKAIERGVKVKFIANIDEKNVEGIKAWMKMGAEFRYYDEKKIGAHGMRMSIFDNKKCRITIGRPDVKTSKDYITMWINSPSVVNHMRNYFLYLWSQCEPAEEYIRRKGF